MNWPIKKFFKFMSPRRDDGERQKQQLSESLDRVLETTSQVREQAKAQQAEAASETKQAITRRVGQANPLQDLLERVLQRQRELHHPKAIKDRH